MKLSFLNILLTPLKVCDFFKRPKLEPGHVRGALEEVSHALDNQGIHMLGHVKYGSCHSKAILFKVLADTVGLECMLMMVRCHPLLRHTTSVIFAIAEIVLHNTLLNLSVSSSRVYIEKV